MLKRAGLNPLFFNSLVKALLIGIVNPVLKVTNGKRVISQLATCPAFLREI